MGHHHHHKEDVSLKRLIIIISLNLAITAAELLGGLISGSLALLSDALHNFSDAIAIIISYIALKLGKKPNTLKNTFGFKRAEIIAAFFNTAFLVIIVLFLIKEAVERLFSPSAIDAELMIAVSLIGFTANILSVLLLKRHSGDNINLRSAYLHLVADALSSAAVISGGIFIYFFRIYWLDPAITIFICLYIVKEGYQILKKALMILMHTTPEGMDINLIKKTLEEIDGVENVHHVHAWELSEQNIFLECHVDLDRDYLISQTDKIRQNITKKLRDRLNINHVTLQLEYKTCSDRHLVNNGNCS